MHGDSKPDRLHQDGSPPDLSVDPPRGLPFGHLNLRRNPFGEWELSSWAGLAVVDVDRFVSRLEQPGYAVQLMGDKGRGKTTHMLAIQRRFPDAPYVHVGEDFFVRRPRIPHGHPLLVDEIQRLSPRRRRRLFRRRVSLVVGTHEDLHSELAESGFDVETVHVGGALDAPRLREILNRRIEAARRGPGRLPQVTIRTSRTMIGRFGDDVRAIQWHMYDLFQTLRGIQDV
ncbi:MAG TPA: hypothetical protein VMY37_03095 [Thermoguttaceae bacterium]|nr:hypothetical protein [Thermoguttaceae bacterium]